MQVGEGQAKSRKEDGGYWGFKQGQDMLCCVFKAITQSPLWNLPEGDDDDLPGWWS